jgi:hypothetical protein
VHRIGSTARSDAIALEIPHRQTNCEIADVISDRPGRWLTGPGGMGVVVRDFGHFDLDFLRAAAGRLVATLQEIGCGASLAPLPRDTFTNVLVAVVDTLSNSALRSLATQAREGVVIFCRRDLRKPEGPVAHTPSSDCITAQSLGWRITHACTDGVLLEKDGRCVALIDEPVALTAADEVVTDMVDRLAALGWRPIIAWRDAPRDRTALNTLLNSHSMPISRDQTLHTLLERFALEPAPAASAGDRENAHGEHPLEASGEADLGAAVSDEALDVELFLAEPADPVALSLVPTNAELRPSPAHPAPDSGQTVSLRDNGGPESEIAAHAFASLVDHAVESAAAVGHAPVPHSPEAAASQQRTSVSAAAGRDLERSDTPEAVQRERDHRPESAGEGNATPGETTVGSDVERIDPAALDSGHEVDAAA